jgi:hypothetical protein
MADSHSRLVIVLEAREKLATKTEELSRAATNRIRVAKSGIGQWRAIVEARDDAVFKISGVSRLSNSAAARLNRLRSEIGERQAIAEARRGVLLAVTLLSMSLRSIINRIPLLKSKLDAEGAIVKARGRMFREVKEISDAAKSTDKRALDMRAKVGGWAIFADALEKVAYWNTNVSRLGRSVADKMAEGKSKLAKWEPKARVREKTFLWSGSYSHFRRSLVDRIYDRDSRSVRWLRNVRESVLFTRAASSFRSITDSPWRVIQGQNLWVIAAGAAVIVIAGRLVISAFAGPNPIAPDSASEAVEPSMDPESALAAIRESGFELPEISEPSGIVLPLELFSAAATPPPEGEFGGAYVLGVTHLTDNSSLVRMFVSSVPEGSYHAVVVGSEELDYQCLTLEGLADRLYCVGPRLHGDGLIRLSLFRINEANGTQVVVFETEFNFADAPIPTDSTPVVPIVYGGGFTWPDRFDGAEIQRENQSSERLWPLSLLLGFVPYVYHILSQRGHRLKRPLVESHELEPAH